MLSNNAKSSENSEPTTRNPPSCLSDRWLNKEEKEARTRSSGSSSGGSSASDLKRRLQDLPSPNEAAFVASRAINTSRRLSRKRDLYFYSASNRIEENEEKEEQESHQSRRSLESKNSDARSRRRAKLRAGVMLAQMIASRSTSENNSDDAPSLDETPRTGSQQHTPLSRTPSTLSARCDQLPVINDSSRSQKSPPLFRVFSNTASLCSPPSKFGGYRPNSGVILHNLSSGSDPGSDYDNVTDRIGFPAKIELGSASSYDRVSRMPTLQEVFPSQIDLGSASSYERVSRMPTPQEVLPSQIDLASASSYDPVSRMPTLQEVFPSQIDLGSASSYERVSRMPTPQEVLPSQIDLASASSYDRVSRMATPQEVFNNLDSSRNLAASPGSRMSLDESETAIDESPLNDEHDGSSTMSFYRVKDTSRSDCCNTKNSTDKTSDQRKFLSARESLRGYRKQTLEPSSPFGIRRDVSAENAPAEALRSYQKVSSSKDSLSNLSYSNFIINTDQTGSSGGPYAKGSVQSLDSVSSKPGFENLKMQFQKSLESPVIKAALSEGHSARGNIQSLESMSSKPGFENLKTQYQENLESPVTKAALSEGHSARGSIQSLESMSSKPGFDNLKTQYQENLEPPVTNASFSEGHSARGSIQSLESMSSKPGFENLKTQYQENLESPVTKTSFSGGHSARGSIQSLESMSSKPGFENLKTQYQENLESPVTKTSFSGGHSARGSIQSLESVSSKPGFENLKTQYQENLESPVTKTSFSGGHSARGSIQSLESVSSKPGFDNLKMQYQENLGSPVTSASSKRFLDPSEIQATRIPLSTSRMHEGTKRLSPSQLRVGSSERSSAKLDVYSNDSQQREGSVLGRVSTMSQDSPEYINVPSLALNSQDVSSSASSLNKVASRKHVNAADLMEALSNVSLLQTENTYRLSPGTNSGKREIVNALKTSMKFDENYERCTSSRSHSTNPAESLKSRERAGSGPVSTESNRQAHLKDFLESDSECEINLPSEKESSALNSSSSLLHVDEIFKSEPPANKQDPNEDSENSESSRSEGKPTNSYTTSLNCYKTRESLSNDMENSEAFLTELKSVESTYPISYQVNYLQSNYEGKVSEKLTERARINLLENQIGDGQDAFVEDPDKYESSTSSDDEDLQGKPIEGKVRVSLEKMAAEQFRRNIFAEQARAIQSDTLSFFNDKLYDSPISVAQSASTSKLRYCYDSPKFRKKSQDRFPFTMSEKPSIASHKHPGRLESLNEESKSLERTYKLELHPSITRLAGEGFEDTPAEIIDYVSFSEERPPRSGMRRLMMKFSARLKKSKKRDEEAGAKAMDVLYKNRNYQGDSLIDSCSESSLLKDLKVSSSVSKNPSKESPDEKSSVVTEKSLIKNQSSKDTLHSTCSYRRRDRDNLWVQEIEKPDSNRIEEIKITETPKKTEDKARKDPYSVFFVKSSQQTLETSARGSAPKEEPKSELSTGKRNKVVFGSSALSVKPKESAKNVLRVQIKRRDLGNRKEAGAGCLCLRFYRMIIPVARHRSRNSKSAGSLSVRRRPGFSPGKKKG